MILSFKKQFPDKILSGEKIHTIREDPHGRWVPGRNIHFATGVRSKKYNCFKEAVCVSVQPILINYYDIGNFIRRVEIVIDGEMVLGRDSELIKQLAKNDGFNSVDDFFKWFDVDFQGKIVHWTSFRY